MSADVVIRLVYRVEQDYLQASGGYWRPWSKTDYATKADALAARDRITEHFGVPEDHLRVVRVTTEIVG